MDGSKSGRLANWQANYLPILKASTFPFSSDGDEERREMQPPNDGDSQYYPDGDWLTVKDVGIFVITIGPGEEDCRLTYVPSSQLNEELREKGVWEVEKEGQMSIALPEFPLILSVSHDAQTIGLAYQSQGEGESPRIDLYKLDDIRSKKATPFASHSISYDIRLVRWSKVGKHRLLIGGRREMSFIMEDFSLSQPRDLKADLGSADWSPDKDNVIAVAYWGKALQPPPEFLMDPFFEEEGELVLEQALTGDVLKNLPCSIRDVSDEENIDDIDPEFRADRHNIMHLAWLSRDMIVGVSRRGDIGLLCVASAPAAGFAPSGLPPLATPTTESRLFASLLESSPEASTNPIKFLFITHSLEQYIHTADLTKDLESDPSRKTGQPRARPLGPAGTDEGLPLVLPDQEAEEGVPLKQRCCGIGLLLAKTGFGQQPFEPFPYRPLLVAMGVGGHLFVFALQDGSDLQAEQALLRDAPKEPVALPPKKAATAGLLAQAKPPTSAAPAPAPATSSIFASPFKQAPTSTGAFGSTTTAPFSFAGTTAAGSGGGSAFGQTKPSPFSFSTATPSTSSLFGSTPTSTATSAPDKPAFAATATPATGTTISSFSFKAAPQVVEQKPQPSKASSLAPAPASSITPSAGFGMPSSTAAAQQALPDSDEEDASHEIHESSLAIDEAADREDDTLAMKRLESLPASLPAGVRSQPAASAPKTSDQLMQEILDLAEHKQHAGDGEVADKLSLIKDVEQRKTKTERIKNLKSMATELLDRVELFQAEVGLLEDRTKTLYGKQLELARSLRQIALIVQQEEARRADSGGGSNTKGKGGRPWEADFLDAFGCVDRETIVDDVENLAHAIGRMLARVPPKAGAAASSSFQSPNSMRSPTLERSRGYRQSLRERHGNLKGGSAVKDWLGSQAEAQLRQDVIRELRAVWKEKDILWNAVADDPETGFRLERCRAQRRQRDRWASPEIGPNGRYHGGNESPISGRYGTSSLALRDSPESDIGGGMKKAQRRGKKTLREARRVAMLLGLVREELDGEEEVEIQGAQAGDSERTKHADLEALRKKRDERIQENKRNTAQVRSAVMSTVPAPQTKPVPVQQAKSPALASAPAPPKTGGLMPWATAPKTSAAEKPQGAWPGASGTGQTLGGIGGGAKAEAKPFASSQLVSEPKRAASEAPKPAPAKPTSSSAAPLPPMPTKAPSVFNPNAAASKPVTSLGTFGGGGGGNLTRQPSFSGVGTATSLAAQTSIKAEAKPSTSASAPAPASSLGTSAFPPMGPRAPKPFQQPGAAQQATPVKSQTTAAGASGFSTPTTAKETASAAKSSTTAAIPPMPTQAPSSFSFGGLSLGGPASSGGMTLGGGAKEPAKTSIFGEAKAPAPASAPEPSGPPSLGGLSLGVPKAPAPAPDTPAPAPAPATLGSTGGSSWPPPPMPGGGVAASNGGSMFGASLPARSEGLGAASTGSAFGGLSLAPTTPSQVTPTPSTPAKANLFGTPQPTAGAASPFGQAFKPTSTAGTGMTFGSMGLGQQQQPQQQQQLGLGAMGGGTGGFMGGGGGPPVPGGGPDSMRRFYEKYEPNKAAQAAQLWAKYQAKPADMWLKMFSKYNVPEDERRNYFPEYGTPQGQPQQALGGQRPPLQQNQSPLSTATSAQFGRAGSGLGLGMGGFGGQMATPPASQPSGFSNFAAKASPFGGSSPATGFGQPQAGGFGTPQQQQPTGFGQQQQQHQPQTGFGGFGGGQPQQQQQQVSPFGQPQQPTGFGSPFGQQQPQGDGTNLFGQPSQPNPGFGGGWPR